MGLTFRLGQIPLGVFTDTSNNVGIGAAPSGTYKFEVTGTAKISGVATFGSTLSNGTYSYTLPSATGTLALTSALGDYVTLATTQTITGAKTFNDYQIFTNAITANSGIAFLNGVMPPITSSYYSGIGGNSTGISIIYRTGGGTNYTNNLNFPASNNSYSFPSSGGTLALTTDLSGYLPLTGGTLTGLLTGYRGNFTGADGDYVFFINGGTGTGNSYGLRINAGTNGSDYAIRVKNAAQTSDLFTLLGTGAATFSSTVTLVNDLTINAALTPIIFLNTTSTNKASGFVTQESGTNKWGIGSNFGTADGTFNIYNYGAGARYLTIATSGAATFSSSVTATSESDSASSLIQHWALNSLPNQYNLKLNTIVSSGLVKYSFDLRNNNSDYTNNLVLDRGNVGIGTSSPSQILDVRKATASGDTQFNFANSQNSSSGNTSVTSSIYLGFYDDSNGLASANKIVSGKSGDYTSAPTANSFLAFYTTAANSCTEKMRITTDGAVLVGATALPSASISGVALQNPRTLGATLFSVGTVTDSRIMVQFINGNGVVGSIDTNGSTTIYNVTSDYRLKQDLKDYKGLNLISAIKTYDYQWKSDKSRMYGVMAHELAEVLPYAVTGLKDGKEMQSVDYSKIVPVLVKAIQELKTEIDTLKNK